MDEGKKKDIKEMVEILIQLNKSDLLLLKYGAGLLKTQQDMQREKQTA